MAATVLSDLDGLLKRFYGPQFVYDQQQFDPDFLSTLPEAAEKPGGESGSVYIGVRLQRRQNGGAQNQNEQFRTNATGTRKQATISCKVNIWAIELTNFAIQLSKGSDYAFFSGLDDEMRDALTAMKKDMNRQAFGYGMGQLALVNGALVASTALVVDNPGVQYFFPGMYIDVVTALSGGVLEASNVQISSIAESTNTLTLASAVTVSDNSYIVRSGILTSNPTDGKELMGLQGITDDTTLFTTFQGLSRSTYIQWRGNSINTSSAIITNDLLQRAADVGERLSGRTVDTMWSHRNQRRQYLNLTTPMKRFQDDKLDSGFSALSWNGLTWRVSHDCQQDSVYFYPKELVKKYEVFSTKLDDSNGSTLTRIPRTDTVEAYYKHYGNIGCPVPSATTVLRNLATLTQ